MDANEVLQQLEEMGTAQNRKGYTRHDVSGDQYDVSMANLKTLKKKIKVDQAMAPSLWETDNHDARLLATMIADAKHIDDQTLEVWALDLDNYVIANAFPGVVGQTRNYNGRCKRITMKKITLFVTSIVWLILLMPGLSLAQQPIDIGCEEVYTIQANDWLSKIADKYFGDIMAYSVIVTAANADPNDAYTDIVDPNLIEPGWTLCIPGSEDLAKLTAASAIPIPEGLSLPELANATYSSEWTQDGVATLANGEYRESGASGSDTETKVVMLTEQTTYGQLNGQDGAGVILLTNPGGSGTFYTLHLMVSKNGQPAEFSSTLLGDRIQINSINIQNNEIVIEMVQAGPNDPLCCPTQPVIKAFALADGQLAETSSQIIDGEDATTNPGPVSVVWKWLGFTHQAGKNNIVVPNPNNYRLELLADGTFRGKADCNTISGSYTLSDDNLTLQLGPSTMAECGPSSLYNEYLDLLGQVAGYVQQGDNLALNLAAGSDQMNFSKLHAVTGTIIGPVNATLTPGAVLEVKVMDVEGAPGTQVGGVMKNVVTFPMNFEANYNPRAVESGHTYVLEVTIQNSQEKLLYQMSQAYPVLTQGHPTHNVVVVVESVK